MLGDSATEATSARWPTGPARPAPRRAAGAAGWSEGRRRAQEEADRAAEAQAAATERARTDVLATQQSLVDALTAAVERCDADLATRQAEPRRRRGIARPAHRRGRAPARGGYHGRPRRRGARRALAEVPPTVTATVRMHPADLGRLDHLCSRATRHRRADAGVPAAGAVLETEVTTVDATIESALARVREVLAR